MAHELRHRTNRIEELPDDYEEDTQAVQDDISELTEKENAFPVADVFRAIFGLVLIGIVASYFITGTAYWTASIPQFLRPSYIVSQLRGPLELTLAELAQFDGSDSSKPIYIGLDGSIYDVSRGRNHYGPGGSYEFFGGHDGTRAFVTGCFKDDITGDLRGAEEMFLPVEDEPEANAKLSSREIKLRREKERREARKKVRDGVDHWVKFFQKSDKYFKVGTIKREPDWLEKEPKRTLCEQAQEARPKRSMLRLAKEKHGIDGDPRGNLKVGVPK